MAKSLNYDISWETIQNPYFPQGMVNNFMQQQNYQNMQSEVMAKFKDLLNSGNAMKIENERTHLRIGVGMKIEGEGWGMGEDD